MSRWCDGSCRTRTPAERGAREYVPNGRGFMGREWDGFVPPPAVWDECLRVLKPGGHLLVFAAPRTMDLMGLSIRLAGFEIRDSIGAALPPLMAWVQGAGMPKGINVEKATGDPRWSGWNSSLKPSWEPIIVARKPFPGTVAANVMAHGVGAYNVDACRVAATDKAKFPEGVVSKSENVYGDGRRGMYDARPRTGDRSPEGRWPANVVLVHSPLCAESGCEDGCPVAEMDRQSGTSASPPVGSVTKTRGRHSGSMLGALRNEIPMANGYGDSGGASRFFATFRWDSPQSLCALSGMLTECESVPIAAARSLRVDGQDATAPRGASDSQSQQSEGKRVASTSSANTAGSSGRTTPVTIGSTAPRAALTRSNAWNDLPASYAETLCGSCATAIARSVAATQQGHSASQALGLPSTGDFSESILTRSLALFAEDLARRATTSTTTELMTSLGCAVDAISTYITRASQLPKRRSEEPGQGPLPDRFPVMKYQAKAPAAERPKIDGKGWPTVKPLALMRWLVRLVTPPGGTVLEPFSGSGTTVEAAMLEGFHVVGIERDEFAVQLTMQRIERAHTTLAAQVDAAEKANRPTPAKPKTKRNPAPAPIVDPLGQDMLPFEVA